MWIDNLSQFPKWTASGDIYYFPLIWLFCIHCETGFRRVKYIYGFHSALNFSKNSGISQIFKWRLVHILINFISTQHPKPNFINLTSRYLRFKRPNKILHKPSQSFPNNGLIPTPHGNIQKHLNPKYLIWQYTSYTMFNIIVNSPTTMIIRDK